LKTPVGQDEEQDIVDIQDEPPVHQAMPDAIPDAIYEQNYEWDIVTNTTNPELEAQLLAKSEESDLGSKESYGQPDDLSSVGSNMDSERNDYPVGEEDGEVYEEDVYPEAGKVRRRERARYFQINPTIHMILLLLKLTGACFLSMSKINSFLKLKYVCYFIVSIYAVNDEPQDLLHEWHTFACEDRKPS
jgi:hypothetical protein